MQYNSTSSTAPVPMGIIVDGGRPFLAATPNLKWVVYAPSAQSGIMSYATEAQVTASSGTTKLYHVNRKSDTAGLLTCTTSFSGGFDSFYLCVVDVYFGRATFSQTGCTKIPMKIATIIYS
jgi:hypothetical protein